MNVNSIRHWGSLGLPVLALILGQYSTSAAAPSPEEASAAALVKRFEAARTSTRQPSSATAFVSAKGRAHHTVVQLSNPWGTALIASRGAHLLSWVPKHLRPVEGVPETASANTPGDVFWMSTRSGIDGELRIRGGLPLLGPWTGRNPWGKPTPPSPLHGFWRTSQTIVTDPTTTSDGTEIGFLLPNDLWRSQVPGDQWPDGNPHLDFAARFKMGSALELVQRVTNVGTEPTDVELGSHGYFLTPHVGKTTVDNLTGKHYLDRTQGDQKMRFQGALHAFDGEIDRLFLRTNDSLLTVSMPGRTLRIKQRGNRQTTLWNPGAGTPKTLSLKDVDPDAVNYFLCAEPMATRPLPVRLEPGDWHEVAMTVMASNPPEEESK